VSSLLLLKLLLTPCFVVLVSIIQRRWGDGVGGRLIGLPVTTVPFILIIYIQEGSSFAARAAHGVIVGQIALITFSWVYAMSVSRMSWAPSLAMGTVACLITGAVVTSFEIPLVVLLPTVIGIWTAAMKFWPAYTPTLRQSSPPTWELPARVLITIALIVTLTGFANILGPRVAGALSTYPVIISVLGAFSHRRYGPNATAATLHGLMKSLLIATLIMSVLTLAI
jgi:hypothetical protein